MQRQWAATESSPFANAHSNLLDPCEEHQSGTQPTLLKADQLHTTSLCQEEIMPQEADTRALRIHPQSLRSLLSDSAKECQCDGRAMTAYKQPMGSHRRLLLPSSWEGSITQEAMTFLPEEIPLYQVHPCKGRSCHEKLVVTLYQPPI